MAVTGKFEYYLRFLILTGYTTWFTWLYFSGNLFLYKHERFHVLTLVAAFVLFVFAITQISKGIKESPARIKSHSHEDFHEDFHDDSHNHEHDHTCNHNHLDPHTCGEHPQHSFPEGAEKRERIKNNIKKTFTYFVFLLPLTFGFTITPASLDPAMAGQRGFSIDLGNQLIDLTTDDMEEEDTDGPLVLDENNYNQITDQLWDQPNRHLDREVTAIGFVYRTPELAEGQYILGRFLVFCCIADSIVTGFMVEFPPGAEIEEDTWIEINGKAGIGKYYEQDVGVVIVESFQKVDTPRNPYVFY